MSSPVLFGFVWFCIFYAVSAALLFRAERALTQPEREALALARKPLRALPFIFVAGLFGLLWWRPPFVRLFLIIGAIVCVGAINWQLRRGSIPRSYNAAFSMASLLLFVGVVGLAISFGYPGGFAL